MRDYADLTLSLTRDGNERYLLSRHYERPGGKLPLETRPMTLEVEIPFDRLARTLRDPQSHGRLLCDVLFGTSDFAKTFQVVPTDAEEHDLQARLRLSLDPNAPELHQLMWETLVAPDSGMPVTLEGRYLFSLTLPERGQPTLPERVRSFLTLVVANARLDAMDAPPRNDPRFAGYNVVPAAGIEALVSALQKSADILYLDIDEDIDAEAFLEKLVPNLAQIAHPPRLIVLDHGSPSLFNDLVPRLVDVNVPAALLIPAEMDADPAETFLNVFFRQLRGHGVIDQAVARARETLADGDHFRLPRLSLYHRGGRLWDQDNNPVMDMIGRKIGPYRLDRELGRGGMGAVYLATRYDGELEMKASIKLVLHQMASPEMFERFRHERQLLADLSHPHIAVLHDAGGTEDGYPYFIMEYIEGLPIDRWCRTHHPTLHALLTLFRKLAGAVGYAHRNGVVHRDIKPGNVMVSNDGEPKLLDFGIALFTGLDSGLSESGGMMMTPEYAAPEQKYGDDITPACDIYALGMVLLELLLAQPPRAWAGSPLDNVTRLIREGRLFSNDDVDAPGKPLFNGSATERTKTRPDFQITQPTDITGGSNPTEPLSLDLSGLDMVKEDLFDIQEDGPPGMREPVPDALGHVLRSMLAPRANHRYTGTDDLVRDLDVLIAALPDDGQPMDKRYDALLWFHPEDEAFVAPLADFLTDADLSVRSGVRESGADAAQIHEMGLALDRSRTCLVLAGPHNHTPWTKDDDVRDRLAFRADNLRVIPVLLPGAAYPEKQSLLPRFLRGKAWFPIRGEHDHHGRNALLAEILDAVGGVEPEPEPTGRCPFRGLEVFREQDKELFFGREAPTQRLLEHLTGRFPFVAVLGPSGSGKSSLVQAGVAPRLRQVGYVPVTFTPSAKPLLELAFALMQLTREMGHPQTAGKLLDALNLSPAGLYDILTASAANADGVRPCLIIDQFEELFTLAEDRTKADRFIAAVCHALDQKDTQALIILTMRSDFIGRCTAWPDLNRIISDHLLQVEPMNREELKRAIERPVRLTGLRLGTGLLDRILDDVAESDGELPLLEHALLELYERRRGALLTSEAYSEIGGMEGALARRAESEYEALDEDSRQILRKMFTLCLVHPGEGAQDTRRRATRAELLTVGGDQERVEALLNAWVEARLLTASGDESRGLELVDVAHEALIRKWPRIAAWMAEDRETARLLNRLRGDARIWDQNMRHRDHLPRGAALLQMTDLKTRRESDLGPLERAYVDAGVAENERLRSGKRRIRNVMAMMAVAGMLLAAISTTMYFKADRSELRSRQAQREALLERDNARNKTLEANYNLSLAFNEKAGAALDEGKAHEAWLLSLAALSMPVPSGARLPERMGRFLDPRLEKARNLLWVSPIAAETTTTAVLADGSLAALAGRDRVVRLMDLRTGMQRDLLSQAVYDIQDMTFGPEGRWLAAASERDAVYLWRLPEREFYRLVDGHVGRLGAVAMDGSGNQLASGDDQGLVLVRDPLVVTRSFKLTAAVVDLDFGPAGDSLFAALADGSLLRLDPVSGQVQTLQAADPDASLAGMVVTGSGRVVLGDKTSGLHFFDAEGRLTGTQPLESPWVDMVAEPDSETVAVVTEDGRIHRWTKPGQAILTPGAFPGLQGISLARDGMLNGCDTGGRFKRIRLADGAANTFAGGLSSAVWSVAFTPDGRGLAAGGVDGAVVLWDPTSGHEPRVFREHHNRVSALDFSPDGSLMVSSSWDKTLRVKDLTDKTPDRVFTWKRGINDVAFAPVGTSLAFATDGWELGIWDLSKTDQPIMVQDAETRNHVVAFSPAGNILAVASQDRLIRLWDTTTGRVLHRLSGHERRIGDLAFSPDGTVLAAAGWDQTVRLFDVRTGEPGPVFKGHSGRVTGVAFTGDGASLLSVSVDDQRVLAWDLATGAVEQVIQGRLGGMYAVAFSADGTRLASGSLDKTAKIWDLTQRYRPGVLRGHEGRVSGVDFAPDGKRLASVSMDDRTIRIWDTTREAVPMVLEGHTSGVACAAFSPDGTRLVSTGYDQTLRLWDTQTGRETASWSGHNKVIWAVTFAPNGRMVASGSGDATVRLWPLDEAPPGSEVNILEGHRESVLCLNFSPDGRWLASASDDQTARLWDVTGGGAPVVVSGHTGPVSAVAFSPDGQWLASSSFDQTVRLWALEGDDTKSVRPHLVMRGHADRIYSVAFSPDGSKLASSSGDRTVRIWDVHTGEAVGVLRGHEGAVNYFIDFSPDGALLATPSDDQTIRLWRMSQLQDTPTEDVARQRYQQLLEASLYHLGYQLDGFRLIPQPHTRLYGTGFRDQSAPLDHLDRLRPESVDYPTWLRRGFVQP